MALAVPEFFLLGPTAHRPPGDLWPEWGLKWSGKWEVGKSPVQEQGNHYSFPLFSQEHERVVLVVLVLVGKSNAVGGDSFLLPGAKWVKVNFISAQITFFFFYLLSFFVAGFVLFWFLKVICLAVYLAFWLSIYRWGSLPCNFFLVG